jgi:hypothetical protein
VYLWLYHGLGFRQVDMVGSRPGLGFTTSKQLVFKELLKGELPFWSCLLGALDDRIAAISGGDGDVEQAARLGRLRDRIAEWLQLAGGRGGQS